MEGSVAEKIRHIGLSPKTEGVQTGVISKIDDKGIVWVDFSGNQSGPVKARMTGTMASRLQSLNGPSLPPVVLAFENNDPGRPFIVDIICETIEDAPLSIPIHRDDLDGVSIDGKRIEFMAEKEIVLRCGKASVTLTRAGKIILRGAYLLSRSTGVNRLLGGSIQLN